MAASTMYRFGSSNIHFTQGLNKTNILCGPKAARQAITQLTPREGHCPRVDSAFDSGLSRGLGFIWMGSMYHHLTVVAGSKVVASF